MKYPTPEELQLIREHAKDGDELASYYAALVHACQVVLEQAHDTILTAQLADHALGGSVNVYRFALQHGIAELFTAVWLCTEDWDLLKGLVGE